MLPTWNGNEFLLPDGTRPALRTLTPRRFRDDPPELDVEVVLHGDGPLSTWAETVEPGAVAALSGTGRGYTIDPSAEHYLLAGDETALPAISVLLEALPPTSPRRGPRSRSLDRMPDSSSPRTPVPPSPGTTSPRRRRQVPPSRPRSPRPTSIPRHVCGSRARPPASSASASTSSTSAVSPAPSARSAATGSTAAPAPTSLTTSDPRRLGDPRHGEDRPRTERRSAAGLDVPEAEGGRGSVRAPGLRASRELGRREGLAPRVGRAPEAEIGRGERVGLAHAEGDDAGGPRAETGYGADRSQRGRRAGGGRRAAARPCRPRPRTP